MLFLVCTGLSLAPGCRQRNRLVYPQEHWEWKTPESVGFSAEKLDAFAESAGGTGLVVHGGKLIFEWGDTTFSNDIASASKFVYTFLTLLAIEEGLIESLDDPVINWAPELQDLNADLGFKDRDITFRQLLNQTSGYGLTEPPGERFAYNDHATGFLAWLLFYRVYGLEPPQYDDILNSVVFREWIGFEHPFTALHSNTPRGRLRISARDLARLGLLHLRNGRWDTRQIVNRNLLQDVFSASLPMDLPRTRGVDAEEITDMRTLGGGKDAKNHLGSLGYFWWQNTVTPDGSRLLEAATPETRLAMGYGGKFAMTLIPEDDLIIIWFDVHHGEVWSPFDEIGRFEVNQMLEDVLSARQTGPSQPPAAPEPPDPF
ncbi:MAG: serine hydrolase [Verrucomicrobia bacterium]|nr:serine hydrolase [Verrucomicrobiota bacterium]MCH8526270.1 serine hydrolase [Kiritimatiellia bacterium]